jgi:hypothetical protein
LPSTDCLVGERFFEKRPAHTQSNPFCPNVLALWRRTPEHDAARQAISIIGAPAMGGCLRGQTFYGNTAFIVVNHYTDIAVRSAKLNWILRQTALRPAAKTLCRRLPTITVVPLI